MRAVVVLCALHCVHLAVASSLPSSAPGRGGSSSSSDLWQRVWKQNPAGFESYASRALQQAMDRLMLGRRRRGWGGSDRPMPKGWREHGDALRLVLQVWRQRDDPAFLLSMCDELAALVHDERAVDELESFLPQLAHIMLTLPSDSLLCSLLERFALRICESNVHWALQLRWIAYAALDENRPELERDGSVKPSAEAHARAARLLQLVEQSVVYGSKMVRRGSREAIAERQQPNG